MNMIEFEKYVDDNDFSEPEAKVLWHAMCDFLYNPDEFLKIDGAEEILSQAAEIVEDDEAGAFAMVDDFLGEQNSRRRRGGRIILGSTIAENQN
jgi:hypothetical protein